MYNCLSIYPLNISIYLTFFHLTNYLFSSIHLPNYSSIFVWGELPTGSAEDLSNLTICNPDGKIGRFGSAVEVVDLNGDGYQDLIGKETSH